MNEIDQLEQQESKPAFEFPQREPWSAAAVKLLKGVVYHDDQGGTWGEILANVSRLTDYFGRLGLVLVVNEEDGMAWLHQPDAEELPADYESIPKLFHKVALGSKAPCCAWCYAMNCGATKRRTCRTTVVSSNNPICWKHGECSFLTMRTKSG